MRDPTTNSFNTHSTPLYGQFTDYQKVKNPISNPFPTPPLTTTLQLPMPREFNGKKYYGTADVAKILGVTQQAVSKWQNELYMGAPLFTADERAHDGRYL